MHGTGDASGGGVSGLTSLVLRPDEVVTLIDAQLVSTDTTSTNARIATAISYWDGLWTPGNPNINFYPLAWGPEQVPMNNGEVVEARADFNAQYKFPIFLGHALDVAAGVQFAAIFTANVNTKVYYAMLRLLITRQPNQ